MDKESWINIKIYICNALDVVRGKISAESVNYIEHYIKYDEYEMAFEILFLEIMKLDKLPSVDLKKGTEIGLQLKLNEETIYDVDFWYKFEGLLNRGNDQLARTDN